MRVLFADDEIISRTLLAAVLTHLGHESRSASDGGQAWELFQAEPVPLVILDLDMPALDGLEVCRRIRARKQLDSITILTMTARHTPDLVEQSLRAGASEAGRDGFGVF